MAQRRDKLIKKLNDLKRDFPEFAGILQGAINAIGKININMGQEKEYW
jgi:hypothetical protein